MLSHAEMAPGITITADLPGERIRVVVTEVLDDGRLMAQIPTAPMGKTHQYKMGDVIPFERRQGALGDEWKAVDLAAKRQEEDTAKYREQVRQK